MTGPANSGAGLIAWDRLAAPATGWRGASPFPHFVVDGFFDGAVARQLEAEFPAFDAPCWHEYSNAIEEKKTCNNWNVFPRFTYSVFCHLNSPSFTDALSRLLFGDRQILVADAGLHGGGWHGHRRGGKLNPHLDYSLHPKLGLQRKLNVIVYLNAHWQPAWGGSLGLWHAIGEDEPGALAAQIAPLFNRAVIFDTTCNSWHGLPDPITCPDHEIRKSLAVYYLTEPVADFSARTRALFAPTEAQKGSEAVLDLIRLRSQEASVASVYRKK